MAHQVIVPKRVQKELDKIGTAYRQKILAALIGLGNNPYLGKKLEGEYKNCWSCRAWPYRIIYSIKKKYLTVLIIGIGHRGNIYK